MTKVKGCKVTVALLVLLCMLACFTVTIFNANQVSAEEKENVYFDKKLTLTVSSMDGDLLTIFEFTFHADNWVFPGADEASIEIKRVFGIKEYNDLSLSGTIEFIWPNGTKRTVTVNKDLTQSVQSDTELGGLIGTLPYDKVFRIVRNADVWGMSPAKWDVKTIKFRDFVFYNGDEELHRFDLLVGTVA